MEEFNEAQGTIRKFISDNCFKLSDEKLYSQYNGFEVGLQEGNFVKFKYKVREKDGRFYNNIIDGTLVLVPKDISTQYSQPVRSVPTDRQLQVDTQVLIVRQSCLKAAIEFFGLLPFEQRTVENSVQIIAEKFEKWVLRPVSEDKVMR